ncbi:MAG: NADH-quinone oxidoreductase subunit L [Parachlamydiaceae bacterium]
MPYLLSVGLFLPFIGFLGIVAFYQVISRRLAQSVACCTILLSFLSFITLLILYLNAGMNAESFTLFHFIPLKGIQAHFTLHLDALSLLMTLIITGIGCLIHLYSIGYMSDEEDVARYFAFLNFFVFCMLLLVLAGDLVVLFLGWEGVGLASYFLIGFWYTRPEAAQAALKAFVINRIGDLGFLLALILTFTLFGTGDIQEINRHVGESFVLGAPVITILTLLYFIGAIGKSAQLPLYTWLPDAMQGPTPVSALIHAATMVTAGVYLVVRLHPLFLMAPITMQVVGIVGGVTSLFAALCATAQTDLKKVLAFSTVSQLGFMFLACGAGAFYSAMFHLTMHAFVKALLFLSAGNVVHMLHGTTDMGKMGGLHQIFTKTHWFFLIGALALSGVPPFAAFFSKDLILEQEFMAGYDLLFFIALAASILTGVYMMRAYTLTFLGPQHLSVDEAKMVREAPPIMLIPVAILALLALIGGGLGYSFGDHPLLEEFLNEVGVTQREFELHSGFALTPESWMAIGCALFAVGMTSYVYTHYQDRLGPPLALLKNQFYLNELYDRLFVKPLKRMARMIVDDLEPSVFQGIISGAAFASQGISAQLQLMQSGQIRSYIAWMVLGSVLLIAYFIF